MKRGVQIVFLTALSIGLAAPAPAQDAAKTVQQYAKAAGGEKALARIQTLTIEGTIAPGADSKPGTFTFYTKLPNRYYSEMIFGDKDFIEAYNGKSAWRQVASGEFSTMLGPDASQMEAAAQIANSRLLNLKKSKLLLVVSGHAQVNGKDALQVEVTTASGARRELFFDPQSHLIVKESVGSAGPDILYSDYRAEAGIQIHHKIELHRGNETFSIDVTRVEINGNVGERVFDFPRKSQVQLPDLKALFKEIDQNQKAIDKIKEDYSGTRNEIETEYESNGKVKKQEAKEYTFFYLNGDEISTLVKKDDKPLSADEQRKENERVQKRIEEVRKNQEKKDAKEAKAKEEGKQDKDEDVGIEEFLRACQFVNPRRERFRGQDVLVFDFERNPDYKPKKWVEKVVQQLVGVIWIDEKAHDVARLEAYFAGDVKIAGGLLINLQKGTSFIFEQGFINNEVWLPIYNEVHLGARVLLLKGFKVSEVTRYSDYKKFHVESLSTVGAPKTP
jgi:hypothetical protein